MQQPDHLSTTFAALADPTRRAILARLAQGEASVKDLAAPFDMSQPAISKHLRVLERAGLIEQGRQAQWRPRRLGPEPLRDVADWVDQYRRHWEESFERLDAYLRDVQDSSRSTEMETTMTATRIDRGSTDTTTIYSEGGDLVFERTFDAPRELVWKAFTDPRSSPAGGARTARRRPSPRWTSGRAARGATSAARPDREDVAFFGEYLEIDAAERFRWTFMFDVEGIGPRAARRRTRSRTWAAGRGSVRGHIGSPEAIEGALATGMVAGAIETWDRLEALLSEI